MLFVPYPNQLFHLFTPYLYKLQNHRLIYFILMQLGSQLSTTVLNNGITKKIQNCLIMSTSYVPLLMALQRPVLDSTGLALRRSWHLPHPFALASRFYYFPGYYQHSFMSFIINTKNIFVVVICGLHQRLLLSPMAAAMQMLLLIERYSHKEARWPTHVMQKQISQEIDSTIYTAIQRLE